MVNTSLPVFPRPPSTERDITIIRPREEDPSWLTFTRPMEEPAEPAPTSPGSQDYLIPIHASISLGTVGSELNSTPSLESGPDCCQMERLLEEDVVQQLSPPDWETSFTTDPQTSTESQPVVVVPPPPPLIPPTAATPLLSRPESPVVPVPVPPEQRERLLRPGGEISNTPQLPHKPTPPLPESTSSHTASPEHSSQANSSNNDSPQGMIPLQPLNGTGSATGSLTKRNHHHHHHHYHPHRYNTTNSSNNSVAGSSNSSSSSNGASSSGGSSSSACGSIAGGGGGSGNSNSSTLPLDPASLPCIQPIPPPLQYVNVDVKKPIAEYNEAFVIHETREHREISC